MMKSIADIRRVFFLGIGGIGMSALARYFNELGKEVLGYDRMETELTKQMVKEGMRIHYLDNVSNIPESIDLMIWTPAIPESNVELRYFRRSNIPMKKRAEVLGMISEEKKTIAVAGTHGKTTTSVMLSFLLKEHGVDISAFLGGISSNYNSNFLFGKSEWAVMEADEFDRSFWQIYPDVVILTSMDADHLDVYGDHPEMIRSYLVFLSQINEGGTLIYRDTLQQYFPDQFLVEMKRKKIRMIPFGYNFAMRDTFFAVQNGDYNGLNMISAMIAAGITHPEVELNQELIKKFKGIERRFEILGDWNGWHVISDYAHHPSELEAVIGATRLMFAERNITGVFQPHLYSRTNDFAEGFAEELDKLDQPVLVELYPAREEPMEGVSSTMILKRMKNERAKETTKAKLIDELKKMNIDILLILGAGDLDPMIRAEINK